MMRPIPIGIDDFRALREKGMEYVDKSHFIREVLDKGAEALLLPRPRRFGKTLNLSMLRWFFEKRAEDLSPLFADLSIWSAGDVYRAHFQRYPVIFLTLKDARYASFERCSESIQKKLAGLYEEHREVLDSGALSEQEAQRYRQILSGTATFAVVADALLDLSRYLHRRHGEKVVILIDEYDAPIHAGYANGYAKEVLELFGALFSAGLKGNPYLFKAVLTGILWIAEESILSGINNLAVYTLLHPNFSTCFGFTEEEVATLLDLAGQRGLIDAVRTYYNGYVFGGARTYSPWSILHFINDGDSQLQRYWVTASSNDLVRDVLRHHAFGIRSHLEMLLEGGVIERVIEETVALSELTTRVDSAWSLLVFSGYLRAEETPGTSLEIRPYRLSIPNRDVRRAYTSTLRESLRET